MILWPVETSTTRVAGLLLWALLAPAAQELQDSQPRVFRSSVEVTRVAVAVLDKDGQPVRGLGPDDFRIVEHGRERRVQVVLTPDSSALDIGVVLDFSTSVADEWPEARQVAHEFLDSLEPVDCVFLLPFNDRVGPGRWGAPESPELRRLLDEFPMQGRTNLFDAIRSARTALVDRQLLQLDPSLAPPGRAARAGCPVEQATSVLSRRQALVVLTDGADSGSATSYNDMLVDAWRAELPVFAVAVGMAATRRRLPVLLRGKDETRLLQSRLQELGRVTGGQFFLQPKLRSGYAEILGVLRGLYVVGIAGESSSDWSALDVSVPGTRHRVVVQPQILRVGEAVRSGFEQVRRGLLLASAARLREAESLLRAAMSAEPEEPAAPVYLGLVREALGEHAAAHEAFAEALRRVPGVPHALAGLARTALELGDLAGAWESAVAAQLAGADVSAVVAALRGVPEPAGLETKRSATIVGLTTSGISDLQAILATRDIRRRIGEAVQQAGFAVTTDTLAAGVLLNVRVERFRPRPGAVGELQARLELFSLAGARQEDEKLQVTELADQVAADAAVRSALEPLLQEIHAMRARAAR